MMTEDFETYIREVVDNGIIDTQTRYVEFNGNKFNYTYMSLFNVNEIKKAIVEGITELKNKAESEDIPFGDIEQQCCVEYYILNFVTDIPLKDASINNYYRYRSFLPYEEIKSMDRNIQLLEEAIKSELAQEDFRNNDFVNMVSNMAIQDMFNEEKGKELETKEVDM